MFGVSACAIPDGFLSAAFARDGGYADCYSTLIDRSVSQAQFIEAFYTTKLFKLERHILAAAVAKPSSDTQARQLAHGQIDAFAAWTVSERSDSQILLTDFRGQTRSWLMAMPIGNGANHTAQARLYFGSQVLPARGERGRSERLGPGYRALLGFHRLYSYALLASARGRLRNTS